MQKCYIMKEIKRKTKKSLHFLMMEPLCTVAWLIASRSQKKLTAVKNAKAKPTEGDPSVYA